MTLEQLRIFVAVAEREHVTAAARTLHLTQSAVSNAIAALEQRYATRLFHRIGRGVALNPAGRMFLIEARGVLARVQAAEAALLDASGLQRGELTIFASQTVASYWLPQHFAGFHRRYPGIVQRVSIGNTREVAAAVASGVAELGFVEGAVDHAALLREVVARDRLIILMPPHHPWASNAALDTADLLTRPWVSREPGSGTRSTLEEALAADGCDPAALPIAITLPSNEAVLAAVEAGAGVAALSEHVARSALASGRLVSAPYTLPDRPFHMVWHRERERSRAVAAFAASLRPPES